MRFEDAQEYAHNGAWIRRKAWGGVAITGKPVTAGVYEGAFHTGVRKRVTVESGDFEAEDWEMIRVFQRSQRTS